MHPSEGVGQRRMTALWRMTPPIMLRKFVNSLKGVESYFWRSRGLELLIDLELGVLRTFQAYREPVLLSRHNPNSVTASLQLA